MKTYQVTARHLVFSVADGAEKKEYALQRGNTVSLPENDLSVSTMLARGQLVEVKADAPESTPVDASGEAPESASTMKRKMK
jgi:hypothetical protein